MTPTDAQIEAATLAMQAHHIAGRRLTLGQYRALARVGLEAALSMQHFAPDPGNDPIGAVTPAADL